MIRRGDVVIAAFPFVERNLTRERPTLVISDGPVADGGLLWVLMVTGSQRAPWPLDVRLETDFQRAGLKRPSTIRVEKVATTTADSVRPIGRISDEVLAEVDANLRRLLGFRR